MNRIGERPGVLIVDDTPENIDILGGILRNDYHILVANSGERALALCQRHLPTLVLLDVMMPDIDGYEVCRRLKQNPATSDIPVIFVTAANREQDEVAGLAAGAVDFLTKPVSPPVVAARVRTHVELKQQRDLLRRLSQTDDLTGVANRRAFEEALGRESRRCTRHQSSLALLLLDIDAFRAFNDAYGHAAGDRCLRRVASALIDGFGRSGDLLARIAGDRFACILPDTDLAGLRHVVDRTGGDIARLHIAHPQSEAGGYLSVSMAGLVAVPAPDWLLPNLLPRAEQLMAQAKRDGGARALLADFATAATPQVQVFDGSRDFDADAGLRRTGGVWERYRSFIDRFIADHAGDGRVVDEALAQGDRVGAQRLTHTLSSVAGSLGANALAEAARNISNQIQDGANLDEALTRFKLELESTLRQMCRTVESGPVATDVARALPAADTTRLISQLAAMIANYDSEALWLFEENEPLLTAALTPQQTRKLAAALANFDYDAAFQALHGTSAGADDGNASA
jgi:diguanylate cyclase (GGDEF)-like protein